MKGIWTRIRASFPSGKLGNEKGQATIVIGMMMMTFILFFAFVVNVGMLVNARINLQNAADMAAYAGAAVQARQLTQISLLNYEMRRHYKKFLYRYFVIGNMAQATFPTRRALANKDPHDFRPGKSSKPFDIPAVCLAFNNGSNHCQTSDLPSSVKTKHQVMAQVDLMNKALLSQMQKIEEIRKLNCVSIGTINKQVLLLWLFNSDPTAESLHSSDKTATDTTKVVQLLVQGLGLIPRLTITGKRIQTLEEYVRFKPEKNVDIERAQQYLSNPSESGARERTIQAYFSAFRTLGNHTFGNSLKLDELLPGGDHADVLKLDPIKVDFDTYAIEFAIGSCENQADPSNTKDACVSCPSPYGVHNIVIGFKKDPNVLTYYAVRAKARAKILFSPFGDLEMTAYAAARPFGSRIGPPLPSKSDESTFLTAKSNSIFCQAGGDCIGMVPNLPVEDTKDGGWFRKDVLFNFYSRMTTDDEGGTGVQSIGPEDMERGLHAAGVPNPWEEGLYNIPHDLADDEHPLEFEHFFDSRGQMAIWAPMLPPGNSSAAALEKLIEETVDSMVQVAQKSGSAVDMPQFRDAIKKQFKIYIERMKRGRGEDGESLNVARFHNPFKSRAANGRQPSEIKLEDAQLQLRPGQSDQIRTSWRPTKDSALTPLGRVGYSVKFVSFQDIGKTRPTGDAETQVKTPPDDNEEIGKLTH